jgi:hypothetical protein
MSRRSPDGQSARRGESASPARFLDGPPERPSKGGGPLVDQAGKLLKNLNIAEQTAA